MNKVVLVQEHNCFECKNIIILIQEEGNSGRGNIIYITHKINLLFFPNARTKVEEHSCNLSFLDKLMSKVASTQIDQCAFLLEIELGVYALAFRLI